MYIRVYSTGESFYINGNAAFELCIMSSFDKCDPVTHLEQYKFILILHHNIFLDMREFTAYENDRLKIKIKFNAIKWERCGSCMYII